jgi:hypothetical protein
LLVFAARTQRYAFGYTLGLMLTLASQAKKESHIGFLNINKLWR